MLNFIINIVRCVLLSCNEVISLLKILCALVKYKIEWGVNTSDD